MVAVSRGGVKVKQVGRTVLPLEVLPTGLAKQIAV